MSLAALLAKLKGNEEHRGDLADHLTALDARMTALENKLAANGAVDLTAFEARIAALEDKPTPFAALNQFDARITALENKPAPEAAPQTPPVPPVAQ
jgi:BMFP domain-containing protein YqiC